MDGITVAATMRSCFREDSFRSGNCSCSHQLADPQLSASCTVAGAMGRMLERWEGGGSRGNGVMPTRLP